jgi:hypothetical protein
MSCPTRRGQAAYRCAIIGWKLRQQPPAPQAASAMNAERYHHQW